MLNHEHGPFDPQEVADLVKSRHGLIGTSDLNLIEERLGSLTLFILALHYHIRQSVSHRKSKKTPSKPRPHHK